MELFLFVSVCLQVIFYVLIYERYLYIELLIEVLEECDHHSDSENHKGFDRMDLMKEQETQVYWDQLKLLLLHLHLCTPTIEINLIKLFVITIEHL